MFLTIGAGRVAFVYLAHSYGYDAPRTHYDWFRSPASPATWGFGIGRHRKGFHALGFESEDLALDPARETHRYICIPFWLVALATLAFPAARSVRRRSLRHRNAQLGLCHACGYDLRASPERCPECGAANPAAG